MAPLCDLGSAGCEHGCDVYQLGACQVSAPGSVGYHGGRYDLCDWHDFADGDARDQVPGDSQLLSALSQSGSHFGGGGLLAGSRDASSPSS